MNPNQKLGESPLHGALKVINLFGAPGAGKSATRSGLFWLMKVKGMSVEEVSEYAKYLVLAGRQWQLNRDQLYILAKQHHKLLILEGQYEYAVTDSPLLLASYYSGPDTPDRFHPMCMEYFERFENINFFLTRDLQCEGSEFEETGRMHKREDSIRIESEQKEFLAKKGISWIDLEIDHTAPWSILTRINQIYPGSVPIHGPAEPGYISKNFKMENPRVSPLAPHAPLMDQSLDIAAALASKAKDAAWEVSLNVKDKTLQASGVMKDALHSLKTTWAERRSKSSRDDEMK